MLQIGKDEPARILPGDRSAEALALHQPGRAPTKARAPSSGTRPEARLASVSRDAAPLDGPFAAWKAAGGQARSRPPMRWRWMWKTVWPWRPCWCVEDCPEAVGRRCRASPGDRRGARQTTSPTTRIVGWRQLVERAATMSLRHDQDASRRTRLRWSLMAMTRSSSKHNRRRNLALDDLAEQQRRNRTWEPPDSGSASRWRSGRCPGDRGAMR